VTAAGRRRGDTVWAYLFLSPAILGFVVLVVYPIASSAYHSFTEWDGQGPATWVGLANFEYLFTDDPTFWPSVRATLYFVGLSVPLTLVVGFALAVLVNRRYAGVRLFRTIFYLPVVLPVIAVLTLWSYLLDPLYGLANQILSALGLPTSDWIRSETMAMPSIVLIGLWGVGGTMIIFLAGLQSVPTELYEAAAVDGASRFRSFVSITIPMMTPLLLLQLILAINLSFQAFNQVQVLTKGGPGTSTYLFMYKIYKNAFDGYPQLGLASAEALMLFVVVVLVSVVAIRSSSYWVHEEGD
jgi:ABC-type sugar transport system permease subunit